MLSVLRPCLIILSTFLVVGNVHSQEYDCSDTYYVALNLYNSGMVDSAYSVLNSCLGNKKALIQSSKDTRANIYRLSALACIIVERAEEAKPHIEKLLANQPYYKDNFKEDDLLEFKEIMNGYSAQPRIIVGTNFYLNSYKATLIKYFTGHIMPDEPIITAYNDLSAGLLTEFALRKNFSVGLGVNFLTSSYFYEGGFIPFSNVVSVHGYYGPYSFNLRYIEIPIFASYKFRTDYKIKPYIQAGLNGRYFIANNVITYPQKFNSSEFGNYYLVESSSSWNTGSGVLAMFFENHKNLELILGGGISYSFKKSGLYLDVGYIPSLFNTKPLKNIDNIEDIPEDEYFKQADDIIVIDDSGKFRIAFSYKYYLSFKAFRN